MKNDNDIKASLTLEKSADDANGATARIVLACDRSDYSASRIARAVEDMDVHVVSLGMTPGTDGLDRVYVDLRVATPAAAPVVRSLERYGYDVRLVDAPQTVDVGPDDDTARQRALEVLRILDI